VIGIEGGRKVGRYINGGQFVCLFVSGAYGVSVCCGDDDVVVAVTGRWW